MASEANAPTALAQGGRLETESQSSLEMIIDLEKEERSDALQTQEPASGQKFEPISHHPTHISEHTEAKVHRVRTAQDWDGPDDPENPHNWPMWKRAWHTVPPALLSFSV